MSNLSIRQNSDAAIDRLAAQKQIYSDAKTLLGWYLFFSIPIIILLNTLIKPFIITDILHLGWTFDLTNSIALFALLLTLIELVYLKPTIKILKEKAAKIQEDFDCLVYELEWNDILCGDHPCETQISTYSRKYSNKGQSRLILKDWYTPDIAQLNKAPAILLCQKENLGWDIIQREKFVKFINFLLALSVISSVVAGFYLEISLTSFIISVVIPCLPVISFSISNYFDNNDAISDKKRLKSATEKVGEIQNPTIKYVRNIQNLIYLNRTTNSLIFDWYYTYLKEANQEGITYASKQLVNRLIR